MFALVLSFSIGAPAEPPKFNVVNKCPPSFTVTNKMTAGHYDPYGYTDYAKFLEQVKILGPSKACILVVGISDKYIGTYQCHCHVPSGFGGLADGEYDCWVQDGKAVLKPRKEESQKANPFPAPSTTKDITAPSAVAPNIASSRFYRTGNTFTAAPMTARLGVTNCPTFR